jgi:hypothetical protein
MPVINTVFDISRIFFATAGAAVLGLIIWWLVRKRQNRLWLPTVRILDMERRILPKLVFRLPPLLAFLCFLLATATAVFLTARPRTLVFTPFEPNQTRIHIFVDMSASVSGHQTLDGLADKVATLLTTMKSSGRVTVSTSHARTISEPADGTQVAAQIKNLGWHRPGLKIGTALKAMLDELGDVDRLFVVSDRDQNSWTGFNWKYLLDEMDVIFYDMTGPDDQARDNFYVSDARYLSAPASNSMEWEVEVARRFTAGESEGVLEAAFMGKPLGTFPWKIPDGRQRATISVSWPVSAVGENGSEPAAAETPVVMTLKPARPDAITADNEFRVFLQGAKKDILLIADVNSERSLEDPTAQLQVSLEVLGFKIHRRDFINQPGPDATEYPFWVIIGGTGSGYERYCPQSIETARRQYKNKQGAKDPVTRNMPRVWLIPHDLDTNYADMCRCFVRLAKSGATPGDGAFCDQIESRAQWSTLLPSLGAKQIGGDYGREDRAVAFSEKDPASGLEVLAFTIPLKPSRLTGINHAAMPVLVQDLLRWQGVLETGNHRLAARWPRTDDIAAAVWPQSSSQDPLDRSRIRNANVPLGESTMSVSESAAFPPKWTAQANWSEKQMSSRKDREDPIPWLKLAALIMVGLSLLEALIMLLLRFGKNMFRRPESLLLAVAVTGALLLAGSSPAEARLALQITGGSLSGGNADTFGNLAREVAARTSLELDRSARVAANVGPQSLSEPWMWVGNPAELVDATGRLKPDIVTWIKRGGFLIIENQVSETVLSRMTEGMKYMENDGWMALPPDHEMMRSFYLLDALPDCNGNVWRGFQYDGRLAVLAVPYSMLAILRDRPSPAPCATQPDYERSVRVFVNLVMVALATDYKKDQIHLPEILKRLR